MRASRGRTLLLWSFLLVVTPTTLLVFSLSFGVDGYRDWGDRYDADLTHKYLFARHPTSGFVTPLWRDDIVAGTTWLPTLHVAPIALEVQAARLFALSPFAIEFIAELVLILTAALGMTGFARAALGVSLEAAVAVGALHAAAIYTVYQNQNIPEFAMPGAVFPGILAVTHLLHRTLEARRTAAAVLASAGLALLTVAGAVHSSPAVFPPLLPLTLLYACFVFRRAQMAMAVAGGLAVAMIAYSPFASILLDTALVSRRMLAATGGGAGGVAEAVERLHGLLSQAISGPNSWGIDFVVLVGAWAWLVCGPRWRGAEVARRALLFGFVLTGTLWIAYMCPGVVNDLKGRVALLRNYSANRLPVFALFGVSAATGWIIERWLTGMPGSEIATKRRWIFRGGLFLAGGVIILQIRRVGTSLPSIPATALDHRLVMLLLLTVFMLASLALLVLLWRVCATPASPAMQLNAVLLIVLSTTSLATVAGGIQAFAIPSGRWESAEAATPMTFRQRYLVRPEYEFIRRHGAAEGRVVDLRFPAVASPRMFLGGSELTSLSLAGLRSADGYATLYPVVFGRLVVEVVNGASLRTLDNMVQVRPSSSTRYDLLPLLGVEWLVSSDSSPPPPYEPVKALDGAQGTIYRLSATERWGAAFVSSSYRCVASDDEAVKVLRALPPGELRDNALLVASDAAAAPLCANRPRARESVVSPRARATVHRQDDRVTIAVDGAAQGILTLSDAYHPGWRVQVDGVERPLLRTYLAFRGVALELGSREVAFIYAPPAFPRLLGVAAVSASFVAAAATLAGVSMARSKGDKGARFGLS